MFSIHVCCCLPGGIYNALLPGNSEQVALCSSLPARVFLCAKADPELRLHVVDGPMKDGLLGPQVPPAQAAAVWIRIWVNAQQREREAIMAILNWRTRLQVWWQGHYYLAKGQCRCQDLRHCHVEF